MEVSMSPTDFQFVSQLVRERSAIVLEADKTYLVESRLAPLARAEGYGSIEVLVARMRDQPFNGLHRKVVEAMTTNETSFFRDLHPFDALRKLVVPAIMECRSVERQLSIWCAACSSGQEPYTIAMQLKEHIPALSTWTVKILATDLSGEMVARARRGRYSQIEINRGLPAPLLLKHFQKQGTEWQVKPALQQGIEFRELNLIEPWGTLPDFDVVFLRNVLIYFDVETKRSILTNMSRVLRPRGYLFLGGAETTINLGNRFERVPFDKAGCHRLISA